MDPVAALRWVSIISAAAMGLLTLLWLGQNRCLALAPLAVLALTLLLLGYARIGRRVLSRHLMVTAVLRSLAISLVLFSLSRPLLEVTAQLGLKGQTH